MDEIEEFMRPQKVFFLDTNLGSPVLIGEIEKTRNFLRGFVEREHDTLKQHSMTAFERGRHSRFKKLVELRRWGRKSLDSTVQLDPCLYPVVEREMLKGTDRDVCYYDEAEKVCKALEIALVDGMKARGLPSQEVEGTSEGLGRVEAREYRQAYESFSNLFGRAEERVKSSEHAWTLGHIGSVMIWLHPSMAIVECKGILYHSSLNQILMLKDKLATRYMILDHVIPLGLPSTLLRHLRDLFAWQDEVLARYDNEAYNVLKAIEPLFKTRLSHINDNVFGADTAYSRMIQKMEEKEQRLTSKGSPMITKICELVERVETSQELVELFGCQKSCGHPLIDPKRGGLSAATEARTPDQTSLVDAQRLRNTLCHIILQSYVMQHGVWPKLSYGRKGTRLERLNERQSRNISYNSYDLDDWNCVEWNKFLDFDYYPNFLELMDDKSISLYRSEKHLSWDFKNKPSSNRRLLLEVLSSPKVDIEEIVRRVSKRDIPEDWKIVSLYPKEREFKLEPRMFAMLTLEMRCFFTAVEANIAHGLFRYLPQQTMTKTKTQNQERFLAFTDPTRRSAESTLFLEIDLTRWNLRWREMTIHMIGHDLNQIYGVRGTFTVTHWFFDQSQIVVRVPGLRPEGIEMANPPESALAWRGHKGGFEGLNQKLWTAATYAMVEMSLAPLLKDGTLSSYELLGQGDNQVVRLSVPTRGLSREEVLPKIRDRVNSRLESTCQSVGQEVKPEENIESTSVLTYSKDVYVNGVEYPTSLKKHSRLFPVTSLDFPSVAGNARAILAGAVAGAENAKYPLRSAIIGWYHATRYLIAASHGYCIHGKDMPKFNSLDLLASMIIPASVGGLSGVCLASFLYKGGSDPLGKEVSGLRMLAESRTEVGNLASQSLAALEQKYGIEETPDRGTLIDNPYCLPLEKPASPLSKVSHLTLDAFKPLVRNKSISPLVGAQVLKSEAELKKDLLEMRPVNPLLLHDLYEASAFGSIKLLRKMFLHTRTVQSVAQQVNPNITHVFIRADLNDIQYYLRWLRGLPNSSYSGRSSYALVKKFRSYWGVELHGVTNHQPLDCPHQEGSTRNPSSIKWSAHSSTDVFTTRGPLSGYLGTATREKRSEHGYKLVDTGSPSRSLMKLQLIRSQAYGNSDFNKLIDLIGLTRASVLISEIADLLPKVVGGSISHRYASVMRMMAASYVGPLNLVTHVRLDTDTIGELSGSTKNYPVMLQEHMVLALAVAKMCLHHRGQRSGELILPVDEYEPLEDDALECSAPTFQVRAMPSSNLTFSKDIRLMKTQDSVSKTLPRGVVVPPSDYATPERLEETLTAFFFHTLRDQNRAKIIADTRGILSVPARFQLDIAEAHALGPFRILRSIAKAVIMTTTRDTFRTLNLHPDRWDECLFMAHNIGVCLKAVSTYWRHPLFLGHPESGRLRSSGLRYAGSAGLYSRLEARVRREISTAVTSYDHPVWNSPIPIHTGENPTQVMEALALSGALGIMRLRIIGDPKVNLYSSLYSNYVKPARSVDHTQETAIEFICTRMFSLARAIRREGDERLADHLVRISQQRYISVYNDDIRSVLRHARSLHLSPPITLNPAVVPELSGFASPSTHCFNCSPSPMTKEMTMWTRYISRHNGGMVSSGYTWIPLVKELYVTRSVLIVGAGNGGLADLLATLFRCDVIGLDLEADMPRESATLLNYVPVALQPQNRSRYTQSDLSLTTTGDWYDTEVRSAVLDSLPRASTIFIDTTTLDPVAVATSVHESMKHRLGQGVYARMIGEKTLLWAAINSLGVHHSIRAWIVSHSTYSQEVILEVSHGRRELHTCVSAPCLIELPVSPPQHMLIPARVDELLEAASMGVFSWDGETLYEAMEVIDRLCVSLLNKPKDMQLNHRSRIALIVAHATFTAATDDSPIGVLQEWIANEGIRTGRYTYNMTAEAQTHLIKYTARLYHLR